MSTVAGTSWSYEKTMDSDSRKMGRAHTDRVSCIDRLRAAISGRHDTIVVCLTKQKTQECTNNIERSFDRDARIVDGDSHFGARERATQL
jgi:hypothetical protein